MDKEEKFEFEKAIDNHYCREIEALCDGNIVTRFESNPVEFEPIHPPPWNILENEEKTKGWVECQRAIIRGNITVEVKEKEGD